VDRRPLSGWDQCRIVLKYLPTVNYAEKDAPWSILNVTKDPVCSSMLQNPTVRRYRA
jgi:hypothetical protein